jgi:hypothetical protein
MPPILIPYELSLPAVHLIVRGLGKLPHEEVDGLIHALIDRANEATMPAKPKRKKREPAPPAQS